MSKSIQEEVLAALWCIASICAFGFGYPTWGWVLGIKSALDCVCSVYRGIKKQ